MRFSKLFYLVFLCFLLLCLVGCSDKSLMDSDDVIDLIENVVPNAKFVSYSHIDLEDEDDEFGQNCYVFKNNDFEFPIANYMYTDSVFGTNSNRLLDGYLDSLVSYYYNDIIEMANRHNIILFCDSVVGGVHINAEKIYNTLLANLDSCVINLNIHGIDSYDRGAFCYIYLNNFSQIKDVYGLALDVYELLGDYFPKKENDDFSFRFWYDFYTRDTMKDENGSFSYSYSIYDNFCPLLSTGLSVDNECKWVELNFAHYVRNGNFVDSVLSYSEALEYCPPVIRDFVINGESYNFGNIFGFYYNLEDGRYYSQIYCGYPDFSDENRHAEYFQKYLVDRLDNGSSYEIDENSSSIYELNGKTYSISRKMMQDNMVFKCNGKNLDIKNINSLPFRPESTLDYQYITVEDFAQLLDLRVKSIDIANSVIYFEDK